MNPRENILDNIFDEYTIEQTAPLDYTPLSSLSQGKGVYTGSSASTHSVNGNSVSFVSFEASLLTLSSSENELLDNFIARMHKLFSQYKNIEVFDRGLHGVNGAVEGDVKEVIINKSLHEDLRQCYREVPEFYFSTGFSLKDEG